MLKCYTVCDEITQGISPDKFTSIVMDTDKPARGLSILKEVDLFQHTSPLETDGKVMLFFQGHERLTGKLEDILLAVNTSKWALQTTKCLLLDVCGDYVLLYIPKECANSTLLISMQSSSADTIVLNKDLQPQIKQQPKAALMLAALT